MFCSSHRVSQDQVRGTCAQRAKPSHALLRPVRAQHLRSAVKQLYPFGGARASDAQCSHTLAAMVHPARCCAMPHRHDQQQPPRPYNSSSQVASRCAPSAALDCSTAPPSLHHSPQPNTCFTAPQPRPAGSAEASLGTRRAPASTQLSSTSSPAAPRARRDSSSGASAEWLWLPQQHIWLPGQPRLPRRGGAGLQRGQGPLALTAAAVAADLHAAVAVASTAASGAAPASTAGVSGQRLAHVFMAAAETQGCKDSMEDSHIMAALDPLQGVQPVSGPVLPQQQVSMAGVFDGHSGPCTARYAAQNFPQLLHRALSRSHQHRGGRARGDPTRAALYATFHGFDAWWNDARCDPTYTTHGWDESGATAVVGLISGGHAFVANTGDSAALLIRPSGVTRLSEEHRLLNAAEAERVLEAGGRVVALAPGKVLRVLGTSSQTRYRGVMVTRALGDFAYKHPQPLLVAEPHVATTALTPEDRLLLLATDGVTDVLSDNAMMELALEAVLKAQRHTQSGCSLAAAASKAVTEAAIEHGSHDNITALTMLLDWEGRLV